MKLTADRQAIVDQIIDDAHTEKLGIPRDVSREIVDSFHALEGSGEPWVAVYIDDLLRSGAGRLYADWRRRYEVDGKTKAGTAFRVPAFGGVTRKAEDGSVVHVQMSLEGMTPAELREHRDRKAQMRDTLSGEIKVYDALLEIMGQKSCTTAGEALAFMFRVAA